MTAMNLNGRRGADGCSGFACFFGQSASGRTPEIAAYGEEDDATRDETRKCSLTAPRLS